MAKAGYSRSALASRANFKKGKRMEDEIKIGSLFWAFDGNRRKYDEDRRCVYEYHFYRVEVTGETSRSWIIGYAGGYREQFKVPKKNPFPDFNAAIFTDKMKEDDIWFHNNAYKISDCFRIGRKITADTMRQVAKIIGYKEV